MHPISQRATDRLKQAKGRAGAMRLTKANIDIKLGRRAGTRVSGLDIQPGFVAAVQARSNGRIVAERACTLALAADTVRDGEVADEAALGEALRELFAGNGLNRQVRVGIANQRTVLRILELPPLEDRKELAAAVRFHAQEQVPMPLHNAVLDFHPLDVIDTPEGRRQRLVLVAAQRDMVERLLNAVRSAGLSLAGIDLSAFALIRSLHRPDPERSGRVLYLNVDGLTNLAIADGTVCRFTRVVGSGLQGMAGEIAARLGASTAEAHDLLAGADLGAAFPAAGAKAEPPPEPGPGEPSASAMPERPDQPEGPDQPGGADEPQQRAPVVSRDEKLAPPPVQGQPANEAVVRDVLEAGVRELASEVRNSLDFHRAQEGGVEVSHVVLSGAAQDIGGFAESLQRMLGVEVRGGTVETDEAVGDRGGAHRLAVATGLAVTEPPQ